MTPPPGANRDARDAWLRGPRDRQGVGFWLFVHRLAGELGLTGWVANVDGHVEGQATGSADALAKFGPRLYERAPVLARVREVAWTPADEPPGTGDRRGRGRVPDPDLPGPPQRPGGPAAAAPREIPPDAAICAACLRELFAPEDRRYRYPFANCTDRRPRATINEDLPYDRLRTTMHDAPVPDVRGLRRRVRRPPRPALPRRTRGLPRVRERTRRTTAMRAVRPRGRCRPAPTRAHPASARSERRAGR
ncbi:hypothetical protein GCM10018785_34860 [Streptomyces longispororuber]|uniref:Acylphosphatase-like domain-containing protein n=1 Tax=Streptomyces longispororuber TaxID=68230 RepID=A0A918ZP62_9ACTN|nr:hypothetical protein GCM10018785_34860 [Streptomyces longispororuber]